MRSRTSVAFIAVVIVALTVAVRWLSAGPKGLPVYDHIVIVLEENKGYEQIKGSPHAPYLNSLIARGASLTQIYAEEHNSEGNYFWLFAGSDFGLCCSDAIPSGTYSSINLAEQLIDRKPQKLTFKGYSEGLPAIGSTVVRNPAPPCGDNCGYARKHVPWVSFSNVPAELNVPFDDFPADYSTLPTVAFVVPNLVNDMHTGPDQDSEVKAGDDWLKAKLAGYAEWASTHNSLLIVTWDENDTMMGGTWDPAKGDAAEGLTDPASNDPVKKNRIATILVGAHVKTGEYPEGAGVTHVNILRTIEAMYSLKHAGGQQPNARAAGISDEFVLTDIFQR
jgi:hypothetical protein